MYCSEAKVPLSPKRKEWDKAVEYWKTLKSDRNAFYDKTIKIDASAIEPQVTWGTSPEDVIVMTQLSETFGRNGAQYNIITRSGISKRTSRTAANHINIYFQEEEE